jgi:hypothetical protein
MGGNTQDSIFLGKKYHFLGFIDIFKIKNICHILKSVNEIGP